MPLMLDGEPVGSADKDGTGKKVDINALIDQTMEVGRRHLEKLQKVAKSLEGAVTSVARQAMAKLGTNQSSKPIQGTKKIVHPSMLGFDKDIDKK